MSKRFCCSVPSTTLVHTNQTTEQPSGLSTFILVNKSSILNRNSKENTLKSCILCVEKNLLSSIFGLL